jgi:hypothetical protein
MISERAQKLLIRILDKEMNPVVMYVFEELIKLQDKIFALEDRSDTPFSLRNVEYMEEIINKLLTMVLYESLESMDKGD